MPRWYCHAERSIQACVCQSCRAMSASLMRIDWCWPSFLPNVSRSPAHLVASSRQIRAKEVHC